MKKISVLIPCYNEESVLPALYDELTTLFNQYENYQWEALFIDDGSSDSTLQQLRQFRTDDRRMNYISLSRNFGKEAAMLCGFDHVTGDCTIILDADLQDPPQLIPQMIAKWEEGYDDVYAKRKSRGKESWLRKRLSILFYSLLQHSTRFDILENVGDFRLLDKRCVEALRQMRETERYTKGLFCWIGYKKHEILFDRKDRQGGKSKWSFWGLMELAIEGLTSFTTTPLRISTIIGFITSISSFVYLLFILIKTLFYGDVVQGFPTLIIIILFIGGVQLLSIGILGEYIGRIFNECKRRPIYLVKEHNNNPL